MYYSKPMYLTLGYCQQHAQDPKPIPGRKPKSTTPKPGPITVRAPGAVTAKPKIKVTPAASRQTFLTQVRHGFTFSSAHTFNHRKSAFNCANYCEFGKVPNMYIHMFDA